MAKAKTPEKKAGPATGGKRSLYQVKGNTLTRKKKACPKCGPGVFLAEHKDRVSCGNCGYTEFKAKA
jgi:ubiquitin-small subunit ribosomal protein S27Ae